eukprot:5278028-Pyramimonas_sp.AAC.1
MSADTVGLVAGASDLHGKVVLARASKKQVEVDAFVELEKIPEHRRRAILECDRDLAPDPLPPD